MICLQGSIRVNDALELPELKESRKVKSMQMFKKNVKEVSAGDRAGICVTGLDASKIERGLACTPQTVPTFNVRRISTCLFFLPAVFE